MRPFLFCFHFSFVLFLSSCGQVAQSSDPSKNLAPITMAAKEFKDAIQKPGIQILDVRTSTEFKGGHIANALQANWTDSKEFEERTKHLNKQAPIYVYCQAGGRSAAAQVYLIDKGFQVINLEGGMSNWKMNGYEVEGASSSTQMLVSDFEKVIASNEVVLVDIGANWCPPCRKMQPVVDQLKTDLSGKFYFLSVDGGVDMDVMKQVQFESLPTFIVYKKGKEIWRKQGIVGLEEMKTALTK